MAAPEAGEGQLVDVGTGILRQDRVLVQHSPAAVVVMGFGRRAEELRRFACEEAAENDDPFLDRCRGVASALDSGRLAKAERAKLPRAVLKIGDPLLRRLAIAEAIAKAGYDPAEPRDDRGRWTREGRPGASESKESTGQTGEKESPGPGDVKENPGSPGRTSSPPIGSPSLAFVAPSAATTDFAASLARREAWALGGDLAPETFAGLAELAARVSIAAIVFRTLFIPSNSDLKWRGAVTDRPDITYDYDRDTGWLKLVRDGEIFYVGQRRYGLFYDDKGRVLARFVEGHIVFDADALPAAAASIHDESQSQAQGQTRLKVDRDEPKLCPAPVFDPRSDGWSNEAGGYQMQITGLEWGLGVLFNNVMFDGCREQDGTLIEAKAFYWHFALNGDTFIFEKIMDGFIEQAGEQSKAAAAAGRRVEWYFAEKETADFFRKEFRTHGYTNIEVFYVPYIPGQYKPKWAKAAWHHPDGYFAEVTDLFRRALKADKCQLIKWFSKSHVPTQCEQKDIL